MDGSIADSTVLRMRTGLQRMHHTAPSSGADGFLEELLKLPATQDRSQADEVAPTDEPIDSLPTTAAAKPGEKADSNDDEPREGDEPASDEPLPCVPACYAPAPIAQPQITEPVGQPEAQQDETAATPVLEPVVVEEQVSPIATDSTIQTVVSVDDELIDTQNANLDLVQPVQAKVESVTKENIAKANRDLRRPKDSREKIDTTAARTVDDSKNPPSPVHQPTPTNAVETVQTDKNQSSQAQPIDQGVQPAAERPAEPKDYRNDDRSQRDRWYEEPQGGNENGQASLVQQMQETLRDQVNVEDDLDTQAVSAAISEQTDNVVATGALTTDASTSTVSQPSLMASDIAAAAGANLSQSMKSQTVTEATRTAGGDVMGRGQQQPVTGSGTLGAASGLRNGTVSGSATGATQADSADQPREISQQERVRLVQRVARSFSRLGPDGGQVTLKLHPPQLGVLNVSIKIDGQTLTARMQTETSAARDAIVENLPLLRERLNEQGIEIEKFQVEVGQQEDLSGGNGQTNSFAGNGSGSQHESTSTEYDYRRTARAHASRPSVAVPPLSEPRGQGWPTTDRSLDVKA